MVTQKPGRVLFLPAHYCWGSGYYHRKQAVIVTSTLTYTKYLTLESALYSLIKEVTEGIQLCNPSPHVAGEEQKWDKAGETHLNPLELGNHFFLTCFKNGTYYKMVQEGRRMQQKSVEIVTPKLRSRIPESKPVVTFGGKPERNLGFHFPDSLLSNTFPANTLSALLFCLYS